MKIGELCSRDVYLVKGAEPLAEAAREMHRRHVGAVVVAEQRGKGVFPVGVLTDRDVLRGQIRRRADLFALSVQDVMTADPLTLLESEELAAGICKLRARGVRRAPVVAESGELVGIVSVDDLVPAVAEELSGLARLIGQQAHREA